MRKRLIEIGFVIDRWVQNSFITKQICSLIISLVFVFFFFFIMNDQGKATFILIMAGSFCFGGFAGYTIRMSGLTFTLWSALIMYPFTLKPQGPFYGCDWGPGVLWFICSITIFVCGTIGVITGRTAAKLISYIRS